jgi:hypothetical protein
MRLNNLRVLGVFVVTGLAAAASLDGDHRRLETGSLSWCL